MHKQKARHLILTGAVSMSLVTLVLWTEEAAANCLDQVRQLADRHSLSTDPPTASPKDGPGVTPQDLARSGGVIEPPASRDDKAVITPPHAQDSRMPTVPDVKPAPQSSDGADRTTLQSLLVSARAEAERGKEETCLEQLRKARQLAARLE